MKKQAIFFAALMAIVSSCGNSNTSSDGIFGEIPVVQEKINKEAEEELKKTLGIEGDLEDADQLKELSPTEVVGLMSDMLNKNSMKLKLATSEIREKMKGENIPYVLGDSLDYSIEKDVTIKEVTIKEGETIINAEADIVFQKDINRVSALKFYYLVDDGETALLRGDKYIYLTKAYGFEEVPSKQSLWGGTLCNIKKGDKMHIEFKIESDGGPIIMSRCKRLKFITLKEYNDNINVKETINNILKEYVDK